ncbi:MAG: hypothetical protein AB1558_09485 [Thermodesulfobacteriota bacterium]
MAEQQATFNIPRQSLIYIVMCLTGIAIFLFAGILPNIWTVTDLEKQTVAARFQLEETRTLGPFQKALREKSARKESDTLPLPEKGKLAKTEIDTIPATFGTLAKASGMFMVSAVPNLSTLTGDAASLPVSLVLRGDFANFRKLLIGLGSNPTVQQLEEITVQQKPEGKEYRLKIWVAVG